MCDGLRCGFDTLIHPYPDNVSESRNLQSAYKQPDIVDDLIQKETAKGFLLGPFIKPPFEVYRVSPIGVAEGKYSKKKRLIVDLSAPHSDPQNDSINDLIDKEQCSLSYVTIDDAIAIIQEYGENSLLCKTDICDAFKLIPIKPDQWRYFGIKWRNQYYFYHRLAFGCRSSPKIFDLLSQAICWIAANNYGLEKILHLLDDFLVNSKPMENGNQVMTCLKDIFHRLNVPISLPKTVGPCTIIEYLGIILDSTKMEARLPADKIQRITEFLHTMENKHSCTKRQSRVLGQKRDRTSALLALYSGESSVAYSMAIA